MGSGAAGSPVGPRSCECGDAWCPFGPVDRFPGRVGRTLRAGRNRRKPRTSHRWPYDTSAFSAAEDAGLAHLKARPSLRGTRRDERHHLGGLLAISVPPWDRVGGLPPVEARAGTLVHLSPVPH